ncbi:hypothetical protein QJS04_geneDACA017228 [Acorus gramineus]|uniref:Uncharacterized protein n=1 Tax=Acorus gramineus TaxID=55184 RepID=A0AAV8ZX56_ACOGR|nr:hypothetical protein QJS04_geneDACA017228 [Acorus gramineus]
MATMNMFNTSDHHHHHHNHYPPMSPRISFSNDFGDGHQPIKIERRPSTLSEASTDFEFTVSGGGNNNNMIAGADELFFKGRLLPNYKVTTLRDELLCEEEEEVEEEKAMKPPKGSKRWRELLGLRRGGTPNKVRLDKVEVVVMEEVTKISASSQEMKTDGGMRLRDVENGI